MTRAEKINSLIENCVERMELEERDAHREIARYAVELGYTPKQVVRSGNKSDDLNFSKSKVSRTLLQMRVTNGELKLKLSFFAATAKSEYFKERIKEVVEGKYTGCYGCGKCKGSPKGYVYIYPDGKTGFRCGGELIRLWGINMNGHVDEVKTMMKEQDKYWNEQLAN